MSIIEYQLSFVIIFLPLNNFVASFISVGEARRQQNHALLFCIAIVSGVCMMRDKGDIGSEW